MEIVSIKLIRQQKGWGTKRICKKFPNKNWAVSSVKDLLRKIDKTNSISRKVGTRQWMEADCPNNTEYRVCSGADMQPGRQRWV